MVDDAPLSMYISEEVPVTAGESVEEGSSRKKEPLGLRELEVRGADARPA